MSKLYLILALAVVFAGPLSVWKQETNMRIPPVIRVNMAAMRWMATDLI